MYFMIFLLSHFVTICPVVYRDGLAIGHGEAWGKDTLARSDWNSRKTSASPAKANTRLSGPFLGICSGRLTGITGSNPVHKEKARRGRRLDGLGNQANALTEPREGQADYFRKARFPRLIMVMPS
jgi:hypothetical protein